MKLWNVFRMELFKNWHSRVNLFVMIVLMCINIVGGLVLSNRNLMNPSGFEEFIALLFVFSALATIIFIFLYPYQMARTDYKNNVMSLMIASGLSRVQYYFVKVGAILIFSLLSFTLLIILPIIIVLMSHGALEITIEIASFYFEIMDIGTVLMLFTFMWLSSFSTLMTAVIIARGKVYSIFIFFGLSIVGSQIELLVQNIFGINRWYSPEPSLAILQHIITMAVMALIGILVLRKQDL